MYTFKPEYVFSKGVAYAEFFNPADDSLLGYSQYVTDFSPSGSMNDGDVEGGPGNMLITCIPDTARLSFTAKTADAALNNMAITVGGTVTGNGVIETVTGVTASGTTLTLTGAVAPPGGQNGAVAYVLTSSGTDKATVEANSGTAYTVDGTGKIVGFTATSGNTYCVKYFITSSSALQMDIPALFAPRVVRAHFAVYLYAKREGADVMASSLYKIRHYYIPYYFFTGALADTLSQTATGSVDLSGKCLTYEESLQSGQCASTGQQQYGFIVDEVVGGDSTSEVDGIYFIGLGAGVSVAQGATVVLPVAYSVNNTLTPISDMSLVTFTCAAAGTATFENEHENVLSGVVQGDTTATASVTNSRTGVTYTDTIPVTVTAGG